MVRADVAYICEKGQEVVVECWTWNTWESGPALSLPEGLWANHLHGFGESGRNKGV